MQLLSIKNQIQKAIDMWNFSMAERLYQNNFDIFDDIKMEYINFLYNTSQLEKLYNILDNYNDKPNWWLDLDISFKILKDNLCSLMSSDDKKSSVKELFANDIAYAFIILQEVNSGTLKSEFALQTFKDHIFSSQNIILKSYIAALIIDYFALTDEEEKEKFFISLNRYQNNYHYIFLYFLHSKIKSIGNRYYWDKYHFISQNILTKSLNIAPKKIAICFFGILRGAWKENLQEIIDVMAKPLNADCFLFSWDEYQEWPSLTGGHNWVKRLLTPNFLNVAPKEIQLKESLAKYMPLTYEKLNYEYNIKINLDDFNAFIKSNPNIKRYELENQESFGENIGCSKLHYSQNRTFKVMEAYEHQVKSLYDIVIMSRVDIKPYPVDYRKITNIRHDEITEYYTTWGSGRTCFAGYREAVKNYTSLYENLDQLKNNKFIFNWADPHEIAYKYITLLGYRITEPITSDQIHHTTASTGFCVPDVSEEVILDCKNLEINNILTKDIVYKIIDFFKLIKANYPQPSNEARHIDRYCQKQKIKIDKIIKIGDNTSTNLTAKFRIKNQLSYKLGQAIIDNSKSLLGYIKMPFILSYIKDTHQKEQKIYQEKIKNNPSLKLPPLETYPDYKEAIKCKNHLSYKLGEALINADKSKFKLGYLWLWFKCKQITKEHKNCKINDK
ncbi:MULTISPECIES: hypothetical protein [Campylobacter]|uniref:hypothetical protein n=1 Tax=Campylobacter TaxID=194 RepID=UPI000A32F386|nr:hypothetical protein [Campylobacter sp. P0124]MCR8696647.1 hypothetical protein [Campylobacter sp. RM19073]